MKNPNLFWAIAIFAYILTYTFLVPISAEEHRYIAVAELQPDILKPNILVSSPLYYSLLNSFHQLLNYEDAIRAIRLIFLLLFFATIYEILEPIGQLNLLIIPMLFPSFPALIFSQSKNIIVFAFALIAYKNRTLGWWLFSIVAGLCYGTFYGIQLFIISLAYLVFKDRIFENYLQKVNLILLGLFILLIIGYWGYLGFHQFEAGAHEESGLVDTVITLAILCAYDGTFAGTLSLIMAIGLFALGQPYWSYRPLELMAINSFINGRAGELLKTLSSFIPAWLKNSDWRKSEAKTNQNGN